MYNCDSCGKPSASREKQNKLVTKTREKIYRNINKKTKYERVTHGWETVKEIMLCDNCFLGEE